MDLLRSWQKRHAKSSRSALHVVATQKGLAKGIHSALKLSTLKASCDSAPATYQKW